MKAGDTAMTARCYGCDHQLQSLPDVTATNRPHAGCCRCGSLTCIGHGQRDPEASRFICVLCDPPLLVVSAAVHQGASRPLAGRFTSDWGSVEGGLLVRTLQEFMQRRPRYQGWLEAEVDSRLDPTSHRMHASTAGPLWYGRNDEAERLCVAAVAIVVRLQIPNEALSVAMRLLVSGWR
jgi:hypothetical protein